MGIFKSKNYRAIFLVGVGRKEPKTGGERSNRAIFDYLKTEFKSLEFVTEREPPRFIGIFAGRMNLVYFVLSNIRFLLSKSLCADILLIDFHMHPHLILRGLFKGDRSKWIAVIREAYNESTHKFFWANRVLQSWFFRRMDILVFNSYAVSNYYHQSFPNLPKSRVVYPGHDEVNSSLIKSRAKRSSKEQFQLLYVGLIRPIKGIHFMLQAMSYLKLPNWKLILAGDYSGDPIYFSKLKNILERSNLDSKVIEFAGHLDRRELNKLYLYSDVFILPSLFETYGQVIFEAASFSLPIACSRTGALPEIIPEGCALFFNPEDPREIAKNIEKLYYSRDLMEKLSKKSEEILKGAISRKEMAKNFYKVISELF